MFAQSDPESLEATLAAAGFASVRCRPVTFAMTLGASPADAAEYLLASGQGRLLLDTIPGDTQPAVIEELRAALAEHAGPRGVQLNAAILLTTATRPA
jgi:hypothetical protein